MNFRKRTRKNSTKRAKELKGKISLETDGLDNEVESYVAPLLQSIAKLKVDGIDLTTADKAAQSLRSIEQVLEQIRSYQKATSALKSMLETKRNQLIQQGEENKE